MFFIVFLTKNREYVVIPTKWIKGDENDLWKKFINLGLNSVQTHLCFYSETLYFSLKPNFGAARVVNFPEDGIYTCRIVRFECEFSVSHE